MLQSIRFKLSLLFFAAVVVPVVALVIALPSYYHKLIVSQALTLTEGTLTALTFEIETYLDDLDRMTITPYMNDDVMRALKDKSTFQWELLTPYEQWYADQQLYATLPNYFRNLRQDILGTILLPMDGSVYVTSPNGYSNQAVKGFPFEKQDWYKQALKADGDVAFISVHDQNYLQGGGSKVFSVARLIKDPDTQRPLGVIMADADTVVLQRMIRGIKPTSGSIAAVLDDKKKLIYSSSPLSTDMQRELAAGYKVLSDSEDSYSVVGKTVSRSNWRIVMLFPESVIKGQLRSIYRIGFLFILAGLLIGLLLYFTVTRWLVTPFKQMVRVMKRVQLGDLQTFYPLRGKDEVDQLGKHLNTMISRLGELIDREFRAVLERRNSEYRALQAQIQPHFLYNTLNSFIGLNRTGQSILLERAILSLSGMLRYTLEHIDTVTIKAEMDFLAKYCELQRIRFAEKLNLRIECDPRAEKVPIPKLLLQPIVENSLIHGIEPSESACTLTIEALISTAASGESGESGKSWVDIRITDNGIGFDPDGARAGVGLANVRERLKFAYESAELNMQTGIGRGTVVHIRIPLKDVNGE
ncbi:sensor histidine kinase [Paenibacillus sp. sptzw28]|uniref:cache domain-containing sensor histidine kinase n=1 Tax=Paenibacillus sp. sptzw28 TaxID=715179 RepID=UPI001C6E9D21|nr:sensor histidine kinase [Paenibacillus sp. sptzw28]QYR22861.1 sensor histidine kinase [Paenibacillus sp. sptzw28]